jgi:excisionase family DNA binding protein
MYLKKPLNSRSSEFTQLGHSPPVGLGGDIQPLPGALEPLAVSPAQAARLMSVGRTFLYQQFENGSLRSVKVGGRRLVTLDAIREFLAAHEVGP